MTVDAVGGVWTYALELARGLAPHGVDVVLATMGVRPDDAQRGDARACGNVELRESDYRLEWMPEPWHDVARAGDWLLSLADDIAADVVHLNGYVHAALPWGAHTLVVGHSCVRSWWTAVRRCAPRDVPSEWNDYTARVRAGLQSADLVVAPTQSMLDALALHYGPLDACEVIPNGRTLPAVAPTAKTRLILGAGRVWDEAKNLAALARIADRVSWPIAIAGDRTSPDGGTAPSPAAVEWLGRLTPTELTTWMSRAAIYALPARYEPFGLSALEAAMSECALVLGDIPSLRETWDGAALFVDPDDDVALAGTIESLVHDERLRTRLVTTARARAIELTRERMALRYLEAYRRLLHSESAASEAVCAS
jgi:glycosyltransferase involved in cell wall biosynthesis